MLHLREHSKDVDHKEYFQLLVNEYYPQRLQELDELHHKMLVMDENATAPQLFVEKIISEVNTLWRAEKHYWSIEERMLAELKFPKDYVVNKQKTISSLITHLRSLLFMNRDSEERKNVLNVLSAYIEIEYKLNGLLLEKERRIYEISADESI